MQNENVLKGRIIHRHKTYIWYVNSKYHTTTDHTKCHMKIHTRENPYHCSLCGKESIPRSHMKSHARENLNPYALCGREVISRNHPKRHSKRIIEKNPYHCTLCGKGLISRNHTKRHMKSLARENLYQCVAIELLKHQKYKKNHSVKR